MPSTIVFYDKDIKETLEWQSLYNRYCSKCKNIPYKQIAPTFQEFYDWSMLNGFVMGARLVRYDDSKPYSRDNCHWLPPKDRIPDIKGAAREAAIAKWNETVNRIRIHYGLDPF